MDDKDLRQNMDQCTLGAQTGPQTIVVRQVVAENEQQKVLDIHMHVPDGRPSIEQIVDVFVKDLEIDSLDVITDKVVVRGTFEIKAIYVANLPNNPVHAVELRHHRWAQHIDMPGARKGMDADASVVVEFVDYDVDEDTRAYKYKNFEMDDDNSGQSSHADEECEEAYDDGCRDFDVSVVLKVTAKVMTDREVQLNPINPINTMPPAPMG